MELKYFIAKEEIQKQRVLLNFKIDLMIAELLTKGLQPKTFKEYVQRMGLGCTYD